MASRFVRILSAFALALAGCTAPSAKPGPAQAPVIVVTASYPGASADDVAKSIAVPIEQHLQGLEGLVRIESRSGNDGQYVATLHFQPGNDLEIAAILVKNRVAIAMPTLPDAVQRNGVPVKHAQAVIGRGKVAIAVIDRQGRGWNELEQAAAAVMKRLAAPNALVEPAVFPREEKRVSVNIDREKCALLGVSADEVAEAIRSAGPDASLDDLNRVVVGKVPLRDLAQVREVAGPATVYRINFQPAVRITGTPPKGKSVAAARCIELAQAELQRMNVRGFAVEEWLAE